jgi:hypothetical protein
MYISSNDEISIARPEVSARIFPGHSDEAHRFRCQGRLESAAGQSGIAGRCEGA